MTRFRCALEARDRDEPLFGTASHVRRWILLEQPGPWGRDAVLESRLPAAVAAELESTAAAINARVVLIRRPGGRQSADRRCYVVRSDLAVAEELRLGQVTDILDVDLERLLEGVPVGGAPLEAPLHLVCTNGRHDACCAEYGRPLVNALATSVGEGVWECSHIGGDRFAGNLVCFPHGLYYGHVGAANGPRIARLYERGVIDLDFYRGRSCHPFVVQAAEHFLRLDQELDHIDDVSHVGRRVVDGDGFRVAFETPGPRRFAVDLRVVRDTRERWLTCQAEVPSRPPRYELLAVTDVGTGSSSSVSSPESSSRPRR